MRDVIEPTTWENLPSYAPPMPPVKPAKREEGDLLERLDALTAALHDQTAAMRELAESNRAVVDLVIAQQAEPQEDEDPNPRTYLDGTPMEG